MAGVDPYALDAADFYDLCFTLLLKYHTMYEEQAKAIEAVKRDMRTKVWAEDNSMPEVAAFGVLPLNWEEIQAEG